MSPHVTTGITVPQREEGSGCRQLPGRGAGGRHLGWSGTPELEKPALLVPACLPSLASPEHQPPESSG